MRVPLLAVVAFVLSACGGGDPVTPGGNTGGNNGGNNGGNGGATTNAISVGDNFFDPSATTVPVNTTVTWTWNGAGSHNVTFDNNNVGNSGTQSSGTFARTFNTAGTYGYHCTVHGAAMSGSITVQ